ncbi:MAG: EsaB/YukD family protein [Lachnospiraceae bacterium]|nr:EsaB/YukD family protein [Lachnospiraceae bacterium]
MAVMVTAKIEKTSAVYDLELPTDVPAGELLDDIVEALNGYDPSLSLQISDCELYDPQRERALKGNATLKEAGVVNGDYIYLRERHF